MADINDSVESKKDAQGKNAETIYCAHCPSKILNPGVATYVDIDVCKAICGNHRFITYVSCSKN